MNEIFVKCYSDYKYPGKPEKIICGKEEFTITKILAQWKEPKKEFFKVMIDNKVFTIYYDENEDKWFINI